MCNSGEGVAIDLIDSIVSDWSRVALPYDVDVLSCVVTSW